MTILDSEGQPLGRQQETLFPEKTVSLVHILSTYHLPTENCTFFGVPVCRCTSRVQNSTVQVLVRWIPVGTNRTNHDM